MHIYICIHIYMYRNMQMLPTFANLYTCVCVCMCVSWRCSKNKRIATLGGRHVTFFLFFHVRSSEEESEKGRTR